MTVNIETMGVGVITMNSKQLSAEKGVLVKLLNELRSQLSLNFPELVAPVEKITEKINQGKFNLVVVGQFKRGKSTLINALVGESILPTAAVPLTSVVTMLRYGSQKRIVVYFENGQLQTITPEELQDYVTEKLNPENVKRVKRVEIELPSEFLAEGVCLVDTPGIGSIYAHNTDAANRFLPESDATIFLMTADQPLSIGEVEFLRNVRDHVTKIFFVLNKVDLLSETERQEEEDFIKRSLAREMVVSQEDIKLFLLSAKLALLARTGTNGTRSGKSDEYADIYRESNFEVFQNALMEFLWKEKDTVSMQTAAVRARRIALEATTLARLRLKAYSESIESLQQKIDQFREFKKEVQKRQTNIQDITYATYDIRAMIEEDTVNFKESSRLKVEEQFELAAANVNNMNPSEFTRELEKTIVKIVTEVVDKWRMEEEAKVKNRFNTIAEEIFNRINVLIDEVYQHAAELFDVKFQKTESYPLFSDETEFYYFILKDVKPSLEELSDAIVKRFPKRLAKRLIYKKEKENLRIEFERQCGRVRYDFIKRVDKSMLRLRKTLNEAVNEHLEKIEKIIADAMLLREKTVEKTADMIKEYEEGLYRLVNIENRFVEFFKSENLQS
jgi:small GTP-binding protein